MFRPLYEKRARKGWQNCKNHRAQKDLTTKSHKYYSPFPFLMWFAIWGKKKKSYLEKITQPGHTPFAEDII